MATSVVGGRLVKAPTKKYLCKVKWPNPARVDNFTLAGVSFERLRLRVFRKSEGGGPPESIPPVHDLTEEQVSEIARRLPLCKLRPSVGIVKPHPACNTKDYKGEIHEPDDPTALLIHMDYGLAPQDLETPTVNPDPKHQRPYDPKRWLPSEVPAVDWVEFRPYTGDDAGTAEELERLRAEVAELRAKAKAEEAEQVAADPNTPDVGPRNKGRRTTADSPALPGGNRPPG